MCNKNRWPVIYRELVEPLHLRACMTTDHETKHAGYFESIFYLACFFIRNAADQQWNMGACFKNSFHCGQFGGLTMCNIFGRVIATDGLQDRSYTGKQRCNPKCFSMELNIFSPYYH